MSFSGFRAAMAYVDRFAGASEFVVIPDSAEREFYITLMSVCEGSSCVFVDWGDGTPVESYAPLVQGGYVGSVVTSNNVGAHIPAHLYSSVDLYKPYVVRISNDVRSLSFYHANHENGMRTRLSEIRSWGSRLTHLGYHSDASDVGTSGVGATDAAFYGCNLLKTLPPSTSGFLRLGASCFSNCDNMTEASVRASYTTARSCSLNYQCFRNCGKLETVSFDGSFTATSLSYFFNSCTSLTKVTLPAGFGSAATSVSNCFSNCTSLTSLSLPEGFGAAATDVYNCFYYCTLLTSLNFGQYSQFGVKVTSKANASCFGANQYLQNITGAIKLKYSFSLADSPQLTHDSLMNVLNGLATVADSPTLTLGATNLAKLTSDEQKVATDKGWKLE